ncbi:hypothetical protein A2U01_0017522, partial [Trifolium medium]|nr:hypothetical protein [Trifolium medium]
SQYQICFCSVRDFGDGFDFVSILRD